MKRLWLNVSRVFLLAVFSFVMVNVAPAEAAGIPLFGNFEDADVSFEATDVKLDGDKVTITGFFKNETDNFQRVIEYTMSYILLDEEDYTVLDGAFKGENMSIDVGNEKVPYTVTVENNKANFIDKDALRGWRVRAHVKVEK